MEKPDGEKKKHNFSLRDAEKKEKKCTNEPSAGRRVVNGGRRGKPCGRGVEGKGRKGIWTERQRHSATRGFVLAIRRWSHGREGSRTRKKKKKGLEGSYVPRGRACTHAMTERTSDFRARKNEEGEKSPLVVLSEYEKRVSL